jgi:hypothetical protein
LPKVVVNDGEELVERAPITAAPLLKELRNRRLVMMLCHSRGLATNSSLAAGRCIDRCGSDIWGLAGPTPAEPLALIGSAEAGNDDLSARLT